MNDNLGALRTKMFFVFLSAICHPALEKSLNKGDTWWWQMSGRWQHLAYIRSKSP